MQGYLLCVRDCLHGSMGSLHKLGGESLLSVGPQHRKRSNMAGDVVATLGLLVTIGLMEVSLHFSQDISHYFAVKLSYKGEVGPVEDVVVVVLEGVVLGKAPEVALLDCHHVFHSCCSDRSHIFFSVCKQVNSKIQKEL